MKRSVYFLFILMAMDVVGCNSVFVDNMLYYCVPEKGKIELKSI